MVRAASCGRPIHFLDGLECNLDERYSTDTIVTHSLAWSVSFDANLRAPYLSGVLHSWRPLLILRFFRGGLDTVVSYHRHLRF
jgi:hypothetical protein